MTGTQPNKTHLGLSGQSDVMVNELTPGNQKDGHSMVMESFILEIDRFIYRVGDRSLCINM